MIEWLPWLPSKSCYTNLKFFETLKDTPNPSKGFRFVAFLVLEILGVLFDPPLVLGVGTKALGARRVKANYQPNRGRYLQILSGKDLYKQTIVVSARSHGDTFPVRFPNIFVDYPLGQMRVGDKLWTNWNKTPLQLWQTQLNYVVFCASSACGVSSAHLNYTKHSMIRSVYRFHIYYHMRSVLKRLQVPLPHETGFNGADNPYTDSDF